MLSINNKSEHTFQGVLNLNTLTELPQNELIYLIKKHN